jgi:hypothetical protein
MFFFYDVITWGKKKKKALLFTTPMLFSGTSASSFSTKYTHTVATRYSACATLRQTGTLSRKHLAKAKVGGLVSKQRTRTLVAFAIPLLVEKT